MNASEFGPAIIPVTVSLSEPVQFPAQYEASCLEFLRAHWERRSWQMREEYGFHNLPHLTDDHLRRTFLAETLAEIARAAAGQLDRSDEARAGEVYECTQSLAESLFAAPGLAVYHIPPEFWDTPIGAMIARAHLWLRGDDLITIAEAARMRGVTPQAIGQAIDDGRLIGYVDSSAPNPRRERRRVSRRQVLNIISAAEQAARRDKTGERQAGALEVIDDLRLVFGLAEKQAIHIEGR